MSEGIRIRISLPPLPERHAPRRSEQPGRNLPTIGGLADSLDRYDRYKEGLKLILQGAKP